MAAAGERRVNKKRETFTYILPADQTTKLSAGYRLTSLRPLFFLCIPIVLYKDGVYVLYTILYTERDLPGSFLWALHFLLVPATRF
jgi:hypothetical protein